MPDVQLEEFGCARSSRSLCVDGSGNVAMESVISSPISGLECFKTASIERPTSDLAIDATSKDRKESMGEQYVPCLPSVLSAAVVIRLPAALPAVQMPRCRERRQLYPAELADEGEKRRQIDFLGDP